jgi:GTP-binding protein
MKVVSAEFVSSADKPSGYYKDGLLPQVAFAGRSNVGKSSLINRLCGRKKLARTSGTPGRTQMINFFSINESILFVDLPGYGYAKVPVEIQRKWRPMVNSYLEDNPALKLLVLIIDIRRGPKDEELSLLSWLAENDIPARVVLTKTDKLKRGQIDRERTSTAEKIDRGREELILFSAVTGQGKEELWREIRSVAGV